MPVGFTSDIRKEDVSDEELHREKMKDDTGLGYAELGDGKILPCEYVEVDERNIFIVKSRFQGKKELISFLNTIKKYPCRNCGKNLAHLIPIKIEEARRSIWQNKKIKIHPVCDNCKNLVKPIPLIRTQKDWYMAIVIFVLIGFITFMFIFASMSEDVSYQYTDYTPGNIRITLENRCNHEINVQVWVNGDYYGNQYLGTGFVSKLGSVQTDIPAGSSIRIRVKSTSYPWHDASTPSFKSSSSPYIILHQDGSVTYSP